MNVWKSFNRKYVGGQEKRLNIGKNTYILPCVFHVFVKVHYFILKFLINLSVSLFSLAAKSGQMALQKAAVSTPFQQLLYRLACEMV